jgi:hypothetical protein
MNAGQLFPAPKSAAAKRLTELARRHDELRAEARTLRGQAAADADTQKQLTDELRDAQARQRFSGDSAARVQAAEKKLAKRAAAAAERANEVRIVTDAAALAEREIAGHAQQNAKPLWAEMEKTGIGAAKRLVTAIEELREAHEGYVRAGARAAELLRLTDRDRLRHERIPEAPSEVSDFATRRAAGAARAVRPPLPGHAQSPVISIVAPRVEAEEAVSS